MDQAECKKENHNPINLERRNKNMSSICSKDISKKVKLRKALRNHGYWYRKRYSVFPENLEIVITKHRSIVMEAMG